jgi:hypothetical protein
MPIHRRDRHDRERPQAGRRSHALEALQHTLGEPAPRERLPRRLAAAQCPEHAHGTYDPLARWFERFPDAQRELGARRCRALWLIGPGRSALRECHGGERSLHTPSANDARTAAASTRGGEAGTSGRSVKKHPALRARSLYALGC